jgi:hypothetical protein
MRWTDFLLFFRHISIFSHLMQSPMKRPFTLFLFSLMFLGACSTSSDKKETTEWKVVNSRNFSVKVPSYLKKATELHEDAVVQYQNIIKEFYFIVIEESADAFHESIVDAELQADYPADIDGYARFVTERFTENVDEVYKKTDLLPITISGKNGRYFEANAKMGNVDIHYHYGFIQGDTTYYQVLSWTLMNKESKYNATMLNMLQSFKEN